MSTFFSPKNRSIKPCVLGHGWSFNGRASGSSKRGKDKTATLREESQKSIKGVTSVLVEPGCPWTGFRPDYDTF